MSPTPNYMYIKLQNNLCASPITNILLPHYKNSQQFTQVDRACIQDEWQEKQSLNGTNAFSDDTYRIVFSDIQKTFHWIQVPQDYGNPEILIIVSSNSDNFARRNVIRKTWMNSEKNKIIGEKQQMKVMFLVGVDAKNEAKNSVILREAEVFGDMIVVDLEDTYVNLTWKSISLLLYGHTKTPPSVKLIGKIDEDVIFYPDQLSNFIKDGTINMTSSSIYGEKWEAGVPVHHKDERSKWYIPKTSYKCRVFPSYLSGPFYLVTRKAAERITVSTKHRKFISVEDVFISGLLAGDVGVEKKSLPYLYMVDEATSDREKFEILAWHTLKNDKQFVESWENMRLTRCAGCQRTTRYFRGSRSQVAEEINQ
ncbi:hypothetical protein GCK72_008294 [Caenorhabditis remanei]|uniref:Hexosyltransferase n=1 Tax=Caenorhabditis remanei TaxID=31234 RepID=A0A6A5GX25_CAERE|nr:hypothetical protein GCK72_008294 [Caenorhabditis remanei]KAF1760048.1 hypothetical protein GCK72_008294 [Caenorhabditis remanei]